MFAQKTRIQEIDGLRGIAILSVVILHWVVQPLTTLFSLNPGNIFSILAYGVDLFFVISGFLIGGILLKSGKTISGIRSFYIRRILRIWPLYYLLLALVYSFAQENDIFFKIPYWSFFLFIFNFWESAGYALHQGLGPLWSIAIEEQFYAVGPLIFFVTSRKQLTRLTVLYLVFSPFVRLAFVLYTKIGVWRFTFARLDGICMGILLSILVDTPEAVSFFSSKVKSLKTITILLFVASVLLKIVSPREIWTPFGNSIVVLAFGCLLLIVQLQILSGQISRVLNMTFLRYLGLRCYFIYLFHIFFMLIANMFIENFIARLIVQSLLTLFFAHISWKYLEAPLIKFGRRFSYQ